jgi:hypothetical protein
LANLDWGQVAASTRSQSFGQYQDGTQGRAHVVRHLDDELLSLGACETRGQSMRCIRIKRFLHSLHSTCDRHDLIRERAHVWRLRMLEKGAAKVLEHTSRRHEHRQRCEVGGLPIDYGTKSVDNRGNRGTDVGRRDPCVFIYGPCGGDVGRRCG